MMAISSPQYVWALFTKPLTAALGVSLPAIQVTFSLLVLLQAFLSPFQGFLIEKFGTRTLIVVNSLVALIDPGVSAGSNPKGAL